MTPEEEKALAKIDTLQRDLMGALVMNEALIEKYKAACQATRFRDNVIRRTRVVLSALVMAGSENARGEAIAEAGAVLAVEPPVTIL
jgi:hypothetical protein